MTHMELVDRLKKKYEAEVHPGFTAWIQSVRTAPIVNRDNEQGWQDGDGLIQIKRMKKEDLQHKEVPVPESEHPYDECLDVIKLPMEIPTEKRNPAPQFLFIRPDEYALFYCFGKQDWCILTGNPGISKSWFQWKFILLCYRQELLDRFVPFMEEEEEDDYKEGQEDGNEGKGTEQVLKKRKMESDTEEIAPSQRRQKANQNVLQQSQPFLPNLIVRTISGTESYLFFLNGPTKDVLYMKHSPEDLKRFTDAKSTILWEPERGKAEVCYEGIDAHMIATVSPNIERFHEFLKRAEMFYMPCPSELQLRLMGQIYRSAAEEQYHHSDKEIHDRVIEFGPFIRNVLCWSEGKLKSFKSNRTVEIRDIVSSDKSLAKALQSQVNIMESSRGQSGMSHRLARYVVHRDATDPFGGYTVPYYQISCELVRNEIITHIAQSSIQFVKQQLIDANRAEQTFQLAHIYLERIFELYAKTGIQWKCFPMRLQSSLINDDCLSTDDWQQYSVQFKVVDKSITAYDDMKHDVLYYPTDKSFPLVDMYYLDEQNLVGIQATMGEKHPKSVTTYEKFYEKLKTSPECTKLHLYYLILPRYVDKYYREKGAYPLSQFWLGAKNGIDSKWKENINFYTLLPPDTFEASYPNDA